LKVVAMGERPGQRHISPWLDKTGCMHLAKPKRSCRKPALAAPSGVSGAVVQQRQPLPPYLIHQETAMSCHGTSCACTALHEVGVKGCGC
jgi:hypothetical protein